MRESQKCVVGKTTADRYSTGTKQSKAKKKKSSNADSTWEVILSGQHCTLHSPWLHQAPPDGCVLCSCLPLNPSPCRAGPCVLSGLHALRRAELRHWAGAGGRAGRGNAEAAGTDARGEAGGQATSAGGWATPVIVLLSIVFFYIYFDHCRKKKNLNKIKSASGLKRYEAAVEKWNIPLELFR